MSLNHRVSNNPLITDIQQQTLYAWANNDDGQLGLGDIVDRSLPVQSGTVAWKRVVSGDKHSIGLDAANYLYTWGDNTYGQLGLGDTVDRLTPVQVGTDRWQSISAGENHTIAIDFNGDIYTWGRNVEGQLGLGDTLDRSSPTQVTSGGGFSVYEFNDCSAGKNHSAVIGRNDSTFVYEIFTWGDNTYGQLGSHDTVTYSTPVANNLWGPFFGTRRWKQVSCGDYHTAAIDYQDYVWAAGRNNQGQLGDGTTIDRSSCVQVGTGTWKVISAGVERTAGINYQDYLFAWGTNPGDGTVARSAPQQIGSEIYNQLSVGEATLAISHTGTLFAWGANDQYQLGLGDTVTRTSPVQVDFTSWTTVSTKTKTSLGIKGYVDLSVYKVAFREGASVTIPMASATNTALKFVTIYNPTDLPLQLGDVNISGFPWGTGDGGTVYGMNVRPPGFTATNGANFSWVSFPVNQYLSGYGPQIVLYPGQEIQAIIGYNGLDTTSVGQDYLAVASCILGQPNTMQLTRILVNAESVPLSFYPGSQMPYYMLTGQFIFPNVVINTPQSISTTTNGGLSQFSIIGQVFVEGESFKFGATGCGGTPPVQGSGGYYAVYNDDISGSLCTGVGVTCESPSVGFKQGILRVGDISSGWYVRCYAIVVGS